jgi:subtilase family serine protease
MSKRGRGYVCLLLSVALFSSLSFASSPDRIHGAIDSGNLVTLNGHVSLLARPQFDQGPVDGSRAMHVTMMFLPTAEQDQALKTLLTEQQDRTSPQYHKWLTVSEYADQFGLSKGDIAKISTWLQAQGFKVTYVANGRDFVSFSGTAGQVESVFKTQIHNYNVKGKMHFANVTSPSIPAALVGIVGGFRGLHDFTPQPMLKQHPSYTVDDNGQNITYIAPGDLATIYDITPLYNENINGAGVNVVIAGQSDIYIADINYFRGGFGLTQLSGCTLDSTNTILQAGACSAGNFQEVWPQGDPGFSAGDLGESDLDIETMSGVAPGAEIVFVTSPADSGGVDTSVSYAVDQNPPLGEIISYSYGLCEAIVAGEEEITASEEVYQKADSLGISMFAAAGDTASAICDDVLGSGNEPATYGQSVSYPASSAYVTGVGGTEFDEDSGTGPYWGSSNSGNGGSALRYIPETAWNDTAPTLGLSGCTSAACLDGGGGGPSNCVFGSGTHDVTIVVDGEEEVVPVEVCDSAPNGGFPKPSWQTGMTPSDSVRDVPDIAFSASNFNDAFIVCAPESEVVEDSTSSTSTCSPGGTTGISNALTQFNPPSAFGGTSAPTPVTAGITALLNQYLGSNGLGLINPQLYELFSSNPTGVFHDILAGSNGVTGGSSSNVVTCTAGDPTFETSSTVVCPSNGEIGFSVAGGHTYSEVAGLGSVDVDALFQVWKGSLSATTTTISSSASQIEITQSVTFTATVTTGAVGTVSFFNNGSSTALGSALLQTSGTTTTATFTTTSLPAGDDNIVATYLGDASHAASSSTATPVTVITPFTVSVAPTGATVSAGSAATPITVTITPSSGFTSQVTLSCPTPPSGVSCNFSSTTVNPNGSTASSVTLSIATTPDMATGAQTVTVAATGGGVTLTSNYSLNVTATTESFTLTPQNTTYTAAAGQTTTVNVTVGSTSTPSFLTGSSGSQTTVVPLTYSCSDPASESTCTISPSTTNATSVSFAITTTAPTSKLQSPFDRGSRIFYATLLPGLLGIVLAFGSPKGTSKLRGVRMLGLVAVLGFSTLWLGSCSGSNNNSSSNQGTPAGSYTIKINATTGGTNPVTLATPLTVTLTVSN